MTAARREVAEETGMPLTEPDMVSGMEKSCFAVARLGLEDGVCHSRRVRSAS
ncbi:hypothetical protein [Nonomuraea sp. NPDC050643]|uniref:hypothetical protein n=1 Tax=Nonomuraea sp. NPDC050643 TaxID=3155660 RepID=UPI0033ED455A